MVHRRSIRFKLWEYLQNKKKYRLLNVYFLQVLLVTEKWSQAKFLRLEKRKIVRVYLYK